MLSRLTLLAVMWVIAFGTSAAEDPKAEVLPAPREVPADEVLPQPRFLPVPGMPYYAPPGPPPRYGQRSVWQMMSPNYKGNMRPTVIYSPYGAYYLYNGAPYPWTTTRPHLWSGYLVD